MARIQRVTQRWEVFTAMAKFHLHKNQRIELLRGLDLFSRCTKTELGRIASLTTEHRAEPGEVLTTFGEFGYEAFIVVEGTVTASREGVALATLGPGSLVGELALLDLGRRTATVVANADVRLLVLTSREFSSLLYSTPSVALKIISQLGDRLRQTDEMVDSAPARSESVPPWFL
jgi:CRP-like cAMP-binding protein